MLPLLGLVRLTSNRLGERGVGVDAIGTIVLLYEDAYEVKFSRPDGTTSAWFTVPEADLELLHEASDAPPHVGSPLRS